MEFQSPDHYQVDATKIASMQTREGIFTGIRAAALDLHRYQDEPVITRSIERCTAYQDTIADVMRELGYQAHVETDPNADVDFRNENDIQPRGHSIGFISVEDKDIVIAYDASIDQSNHSIGQEIVRLFASKSTKRDQQLTDICHQLRDSFGGDWFEDEIEMGLEINEKFIVDKQ